MAKKVALETQPKGVKAVQGPPRMAITTDQGATLVVDFQPTGIVITPPAPSWIPVGRSTRKDLLDRGGTSLASVSIPLVFHDKDGVDRDLDTLRALYAAGALVTIIGTPQMPKGGRGSWWRITACTITIEEFVRNKRETARATAAITITEDSVPDVAVSPQTGSAEPDKPVYEGDPAKAAPPAPYRLSGTPPKATAAKAAQTKVKGKSTETVAKDRSLQLFAQERLGKAASWPTIAELNKIQRTWAPAPDTVLVPKPGAV